MDSEWKSFLSVSFTATDIPELQKRLRTGGLENIKIWELRLFVVEEISTA